MSKEIHLTVWSQSHEISPTKNKEGKIFRNIKFRADSETVKK